jgi:hypothetical protein
MESLPSQAIPYLFKSIEDKHLNEDLQDMARNFISAGLPTGLNPVSQACCPFSNGLQKRPEFVTSRTFNKFRACPSCVKFFDVEVCR